MGKLHEHPKLLAMVAYAVSVIAVLALAAGWGLHGFIDAWTHPHPAWLILAGSAALAGIPAYMLAYRALMRFQDGPRLSYGLAMRIVALGFAPFVPAGGFDVDKRALQAIRGDRQEVLIRVIAVGLLELALLSLAAWVCAILLILDADPKPMPSALWPWVIAVPAIIGLILSVAAWSHRRGVEPGRSGIRGAFGRVIASVWLLLQLLRRPVAGCVALLGMSAYWGLDIAAFYASAHFVGLGINLAETVVAYATGYLLSRRSLPLGGAGVAIVFLTFAMHWVGQPVLGSLAAVVVYRFFNFALPTAPALLARPRLEPLVTRTRTSPREAGVVGSSR
jgi:uncharacterized membrane protein YbhN (UPF0104 family)